MEIKSNAKQLHKHSLAVIVVALGLFIATVFGASQVYGPTSNVGLAFRSMHYGVLNSNRVTAGVIETGNTTQATNDQSAQTAPSTINSNLGNVGKSARLRATLYSETDQN